MGSGKKILASWNVFLLEFAISSIDACMVVHKYWDPLSIDSENVETGSNIVKRFVDTNGMVVGAV